METLRTFGQFTGDSLSLLLKGDRYYYGWVAFLLLLMALGGAAYAGQLRQGLIVTHMRDQVSWGFYIANFAFLVGIAAAAVLLVIPAYLFHRQDVKRVVLLGEVSSRSSQVAPSVSICWSSPVGDRMLMRMLARSRARS